MHQSIYKEDNYLIYKQEVLKKMKQSKIIITLLLILMVALVGCTQKSQVAPDTKNTNADYYNPDIKPSDFTSIIEGNKYFNLPVGTVLQFEEETEDGLETINIEILDETVNINGFETRVYLDTVYVDGQIVEETRDYIAQHKVTGDVWYFGEDVNNYENGLLKDHEGAWLHGKDGAIAGIWVKANPQVGDIYLQEYYAGFAEDTVEVISLSETIAVEGKTYNNCLKTYDYTPLDKESKEHKYYCPEVGNLVYIKHLVEDAHSRLVSVQKGSPKEISSGASLEEKRSLLTNNYNPQVNPSDFTIEIDNPYFALPIGKKLVYEAETEDGLERIEILVPGWTREVMGVETLVFWDRVYIDGELIEDTRDYLAQHKATGDVWYFGEHVDNYEDGELVDHDGAWLSGVDGALPGQLVLGNPKVGDFFLNEYLVGEAEDESLVVGVGETVKTPFGSFNDCVKHQDGSPLFPEKAYTYHCKDAGVKGTALELEYASGKMEELEQTVELVEVDMDGALGVSLPEAYINEGVKE
jgi:hypothetical protein